MGGATLLLEATLPMEEATPLSLDTRPSLGTLELSLGMPHSLGIRPSLATFLPLRLTGLLGSPPTTAKAFPLRPPTGVTLHQDTAPAPEALLLQARVVETVSTRAMLLPAILLPLLRPQLLLLFPSSRRAWLRTLAMLERCNLPMGQLAGRWPA